MRDALGGSVNIVIIVVFIVIALGYMAFNVNYTKAFRMKNKIISLYEETNGKCDDSKDCQDEIVNYANSIGYKPQDINCPDGSYDVRPSSGKKLFCVKRFDSKNYSSESLVDKKQQYYYKIVTKINIEIPIISNVFDLNVFKVTGDTKLVTNE